MRRHLWAWQIAKSLHGHASVEEERYIGEKPVRKTVEERGWQASWKVQISRY